MQFENTDGRKDIHETWRETDRNVLIDFWKIAAILLIVVSHQFYLDPAESNYHFRKAWIYVEMFFLLSGYFACIHFRKNPSAHIDDASKEALTYTVRKWLSFLPYVVPAVILQYGLNQIRYPKGLVGFLHQLEKMPRDLMLLTSVSGKGGCWSVMVSFGDAPCTSDSWHLFSAGFKAFAGDHSCHLGAAVLWDHRPVGSKRGSP